MLSLRSAQLLNRPRKLFGIIRQTPCVCLRCSLACVACPCVLFFFFFLAQMKVFAASEALFALLPFAACATLTIHVICMCVLEMRLCVLSAACVLSLV